MVELLGDEALRASSVVANNAMNRERRLAGVNSYEKALGFDPVSRLAADGAWLDLCCGTGLALIQAAELREHATIVGVDLVDAFAGSAPFPRLELVTAAIEAWAPERTFDLITCVHGLHYLGDKLGMFARAMSWLAPGGQFVADLDLASVRLDDGRPAGRRLTGMLRAAGVEYDPRRRQISCAGPRELAVPYVYLGADDRAGPNYTGQPAVHSYYRAA